MTRKVEKRERRTFKVWVSAKPFEYEAFKNGTGIVAVPTFRGRRQPLPWYVRATLTLDTPKKGRKP